MARRKRPLPKRKKETRDGGAVEKDTALPVTPVKGYRLRGFVEKGVAPGTDDPTVPVKGSTDHIGIERSVERPPPVELRGSNFHVGSPTFDAPNLSVTAETLAERPADIRDTARDLSREFKAEVEQLKRSKPNDQDGLAKHHNLVSFFEKMATGLNNLADALDQALNEAPAGKLEPALFGMAAEVVRQVQLGVLEWLEENRTTLIEVPIRIGLFGLGVAFVHALGVDSNAVTASIATLAWKSAPKKSTSQRDKKR